MHIMRTTLISGACLILFLHNQHALTRNALPFIRSRPHTSTDIRLFLKKIALASVAEDVSYRLDIVNDTEIIKTFKSEDSAETLLGGCAQIPRHIRTTQQAARSTHCSQHVRSCARSLIIAGSASSFYTPSCLQADVIGLPSDFASLVHINPEILRIVNNIDAYLFFGSRAYIAIQLPIEKCRYNLRLKEELLESGTNGYSAGDISALAIDRSKLFTTFSSYAQGDTILTLNGMSFKPIFYNRIRPCITERTGISDIHCCIGGYCMRTDTFAIGVSADTYIPTGNRPGAQQFFEPIIGNCHHQEYGIGTNIDWHVQDDAELSFSLHAALHVRYVRPARHTRSFDLTVGPLSRYLLAYTLNPDNSPTGIITPVANLTTAPVTVSVGTQWQALLAASFNTDPFTWTIGYELYTQGAESITPCTRFCIDDQAWALKTTAPIFDTSITPKRITSADIAIIPAQTRILSHTLYTTMNYTPSRSHRGQWTLGCGGGINFAPKIAHNSTFSCWDIWARIAYAWDIIA